MKIGKKTIIIGVSAAVIIIGVMFLVIGQNYNKPAIYKSQELIVLDSKKDSSTSLTTGMEAGFPFEGIKEIEVKEAEIKNKSELTDEEMSNIIYGDTSSSDILIVKLYIKNIDATDINGGYADFNIGFITLTGKNLFEGSEKIDDEGSILINEIAYFSEKPKEDNLSSNGYHYSLAKENEIIVEIGYWLPDKNIKIDDLILKLGTSGDNKYGILLEEGNQDDN